MGSKLAILALCAALAACGTNRADRAISGGAIGAAAGGLGAAVLDGDITSGVLLGGAAGAAAGGLTNAEDLDLGDPVWRRRNY
ncbi:MAG: hypothetical protein AAF666_10395 [Pseudomonadota bacterium]